MNERFHRALLAAANSAALELAFDAVMRIPVASPGALMFSAENLRAAFGAMHSAHAEHKVIVDALRLRQASRAEYMIREHVYNSGVNLRLELERKQKSTVQNQPGEVPQTKEA